MGCHHNWRISYVTNDFTCTRCGERRSGVNTGRIKRKSSHRAGLIVLGVLGVCACVGIWWVATEGVPLAANTVEDAAGLATDAIGAVSETIDEVAPDVEQAIGTAVDTVSDTVQDVVDNPESITGAIISLLPEAVGPYVLQVDEDTTSLPTTTQPAKQPATNDEDRPQTPFDRTIGLPGSPAPEPKLTFVEQVENHVHDMTNDERTSRGIYHLARDNMLADIARDHSRDMAERRYFEHDTPEGLDPTARGLRAGYDCLKDYGSYYTRGLAENIFTISRAGSNPEVLARQIVDSWMGSPGHRQNILELDYDKLGVGIAVSRAGAVYATQNFC